MQAVRGVTGEQGERWVKTVCYMCYSGCGIRVKVVDGRVVKIEGDPDNPHNNGKVCSKGNSGMMSLYDPNRVLKPLRRTNPEKGLGVDPRWKEISWDEAMGEIVERLQELRQTNPQGLLVTGLDFHLFWTPWIFAAAFGSPNATPISSGYFCGNGLHPILYLTTGAFYGECDFKHCNYLLLVGTQFGFMVNTNANTMTQHMADARMRGMKVVSVDPICTNAAAKSDEWLPIRPGTDAALVLGMINQMVNVFGLYDKGFLRKFTNAPYLVGPNDAYVRDPETNKPLVWDEVEGKTKTFDDESVKEYAIEGSFEVNGAEVKPSFQLLKEHVKKYTPEYVEGITTVPAATVVRLAKEFGEAARIGSKIVIDGVELPYRPAALIWNKGIGHKHALVTGFTMQLLNMIVGNIDVPGGWASCNPIGPPRGPYWEPRESDDGLLMPAAFQQVYFPNYPPRKVTDPKTIEMYELFPVGIHACPLVFDTLVHPEEFKHPLKVEVMFHLASNFVMSSENPKFIAEALKKIPFQVSFATHVDETAEFADIVLPDTHYLERTVPFPNTPIEYLMGGPGDWYWIIGQPVVPPRGESRCFGEVIWDLAQRLGCVDDMYLILNAKFQFKEPYKLETGKRYSWNEFMDMWAKSWFGPEHDLKWFWDNGVHKWPKTVREAHPRIFEKPRIQIYLEHYKRAGEDVRKKIDEMGIDWDFDDYQNLPEWRPCASYEIRKEGYDLYALNYKLPSHNFSITPQNPWLNELAERHPSAYKIKINTAAAKAKGLRDGDEVWIESEEGNRVKGVLAVTECIHPEVLGIAGTFGHWAKGMPVARGKGLHFNSLFPLRTDFKSRLRRLDTLSGCLDQCFRVRVYKA